jgi:hypothetical protein
LVTTEPERFGKSSGDAPVGLEIFWDGRSVWRDVESLKCERKTMSSEAKCNCQHCNNNISFPAEMAGQMPSFFDFELELTEDGRIYGVKAGGNLDSEGGNFYEREKKAALSKGL